MKVYLVDIGILLDKDSLVQNGKSYFMVYDRKYGYYDLDQFYSIDKKAAVKDVKMNLDYYKETLSGSNLYGIVSQTFIDDSVLRDVKIEDIPVSDESYKVSDIVYSVAYFNGKMKENFIQNLAMDF